jgi:hypothetical protein
MYAAGTPIWAPGGPKLRPATILKEKHVVKFPNFLKTGSGIDCIVKEAEVYTVRIEDTGEVLQMSERNICGVRNG